MLLTLFALPCPGEEPLRFLSWNVESEGNSPAVIAKQLADLPSYDLYALTEVDPANFRRYGSAIGEATDRCYRWLTTATGNKDRMMIIYDARRLQLEDHYELVIKPDTPPDVYDIEVGLYLAATGGRLGVLDERGRLRDNRVLLSKVRVVSP